MKKQIIFACILEIILLICITEFVFYYFELKSIVSYYLVLIGNYFDVILIIGFSLIIVIWNILIFKK